MWLEILAAAAIILSRAQRMQLTLVYGAQSRGAARRGLKFASTHPLMMADPLSPD